MIIEKKTKSLGTLQIRDIPYDVAKKVIIKNHYSKKWNAAFGKYNYGIFRENELLGVCVYGLPMNPMSDTSILKTGNLIELNRLWISDVLGKNAESIFISSTFNLLKKDAPHIDAVQSFADGRLGVGTIYKATNFRYYGYHKTLFFENKKTGVVYHKVLLQNTNRMTSFLGKNIEYLDGLLVPFYVKTYRYIYLLNKSANVLLKEQPYPDYERGIIESDYIHPVGLFARLYLFYSLFGNTEYAKKAKQKAISVYSEHSFLQAVEIQKENPEYLKYATTNSLF